MDPFLKWLGRKDKIAQYITALFPPLTQDTVYYEPFLGSGALAGSLAKQYQMTYILNEGNPDLFWVYNHLVSDLEALLLYIKAFYAAGPSQYYTYRDQYNNVLAPGDVRRSALFIYFNRFGYNGLCRYNQSGGFNTPRGKHKTVYLPEAELRQWAHWLKTYPRVAISNDDFAQSIFTAGKGAVVYLDPPYYPLSNTASFDSYGGPQWHHINDHIRLADEAYASANSGSTVVISNNDVPFIRELYKERGAEIVTVPPMRRSVSSGDRGYVSEILAVWR